MNTKAITSDRKAHQHRRIVIKSRFRLTLFIVVLLTLITCAFSFFLLKGNAKVMPEYYLTWSVSKGDTLWDIASCSLPKGRDIRDYILEIREYNELDTPNIIEGQLLEVPIYGNSRGEATSFSMIN